MNVRLILSIAIFLTYRNAAAQDLVQLYTDSIPNCSVELPAEERPTLEIYRPLKEKATGTSVIIFPGGAYAFLAYQEEGVLIAKAFAERGITAFVVKYRLPQDRTMRDKSFGPLMDAQQAIKRVRVQASSWGVDPRKIGAIGYSAGGHLVSTLGTHYTKSYISNKDSISLRPDFMILVYPVISMQESLTHMGSRISLLGLEPVKEKVELFSNELQVTKDTPPTYLTHSGDDILVDVNNSIVFYQALQKHKVDAELHLFPNGNHGFTQRLPVNEWLDPMLLFIKKCGF